MATPGSASSPNLSARARSRAARRLLTPLGRSSDQLLALPRPLAEGGHQRQGAGRVASDVLLEGYLAHPGDLAIGERLRRVAMAPARTQGRLAEEDALPQQRHGRLLVRPVGLVHPDLSLKQETQNLSASPLAYTSSPAS
jgi:hypothetical protein